MIPNLGWNVNVYLGIGGRLLVDAGEGGDDMLRRSGACVSCTGM